MKKTRCLSLSLLLLITACFSDTLPANKQQSEKINQNFPIYQPQPYLSWQIVEENGKSGFIDKTGKIVIPIEYDSIEPFNFKGITVISKQGKYGVIDTQNHLLLPPKYERLYLLPTKKILVQKVKDKFGIIDTSGKIIIPARYDRFGLFPYSIDLISVVQNDLVGLYDTKGNLIVKPQFDTLYADEMDIPMTTLETFLDNGLIRVGKSQVKAHVILIITSGAILIPEEKPLFPPNTIASLLGAGAMELFLRFLIKMA